jgi:N-carbamoyl-L-amino-acid hydrolase
MAIAFDGEANHAGTTPMNLGRDALVAAAPAVDSVRRADALATEGADYSWRRLAFSTFRRRPPMSCPA